ncbi:MAG: DUF1345 domain-containing protein [Actinomycetota bacterium]|nr:DUF1345 domain-containing protein [Actinomycetota bacterium]
MATARKQGLGSSASTRAGIGAVAGVAAAAVMFLLGDGLLAPVTGWDTAAVVFLCWTAATIWRFDGAQTRLHAIREDPSRPVTSALVTAAAVVSLVAVGLVLVRAGKSHGPNPALVGLGIGSVVVSWAVVHLVFMLKYAELYYSADARGGAGGIDFGDVREPSYTDFAYLAYTVGMTFQVSDTALKTTRFRATVLRHALLGYLFGTVIVATTINLVAGLSK